MTNPHDESCGPAGALREAREAEGAAQRGLCRLHGATLAAPTAGQP